MIRALIVQYRMLPERFIFTGAVPDEDLAAYYRWADAYISLSEHEGFCVPLVEAMATDVPVLAYAAGPCPRRSAAPACCSRRRTSSSQPRCSGRSCTIGRCGDRIIAGQRRRPAISRRTASNSG